MSMLMTVIAREEIRNDNMITEYTKELETLPKGKITPKTINGKTYYYLYYRNGKKVVSKYIGKDEKRLSILREQLSRRSQVEEMIKRRKGTDKEVGGYFMILYHGSNMVVEKPILIEHFECS